MARVLVNDTASLHRLSHRLLMTESISVINRWLSHPRGDREVCVGH